MKSNKAPKLHIKRIAIYKKKDALNAIWETDPITVTTVTVTHLTMFMR